MNPSLRPSNAAPYLLTRLLVRVDASLLWGFDTVPPQSATFIPLDISRLHLRRGCGTLRSDMEPLLELQRKTKAGEVAPLVDVATKHFWLWPGKAYWAYCRKEKIAVRQLELRKEKHLTSDARIANVVTLIGQIYNEADWPERGELFFGLMAEDSWPMVATLIDEDVVDDLALVHFLEKIEQQYGKLALEEIDMIAKIKTVGELALLLEKIVSENREKVNPRKRSRWAEWRSGLFLILYWAGVICLAGYWIIKLVRWIAAGS